MTTYVIADIKVTDDSWVPEYAANVHDIVHKHGGKYLTRTNNIKTVEGEALDTTLIALIEYPTVAALLIEIALPFSKSQLRLLKECVCALYNKLALSQTSVRGVN